MPNSRRQPTVYVSSTFLDLESHRAALKSALEKVRYDVACMETYTAFDERPLDRCLADVAATDVVVLLIAHRYGYRPAENNPQRRRRIPGAPLEPDRAATDRGGTVAGLLPR